jgi:hypothetical protein
MAAAVKEVDKRALPKKEGDLFRSIARYYENKQYKKGVKVFTRNDDCTCSNLLVF